MTTKTKRWLYYAVVACLVAALVLLALPSLQRAIARAQQEMSGVPADAETETAAAEGDAPAAGDPSSEPGAYEKVAETDGLELWFRASDSAIAVKTSATATAGNRPCRSRRSVPKETNCGRRAVDRFFT